MPPKNSKANIVLEDVFEGLPKVQEEPPKSTTTTTEPTVPAVPVVRKKRQISSELRDLDKDKQKCLEKIAILDRLKQCRIARGAAPPDIVKEIIPPATPKPTPTPTPLPAPTPTPTPTPTLPQKPSPPPRIVKSTFMKPAWG